MKKRYSLYAGLLVVLGLLAVLVACAVNPVTGKKQLMLISEKSEISLGQNTDREIRQQYGIYEDQALNGYLNAVGQRMVPHTHRPNLQYHFTVLDTPVINAFAAPGGYIYITRGILALMNSEAELAVVVGHELGHVSARHSVAKMSGMILVNLGLAIGSALSEDIAKISGAAGIGMQLLFLKFSRDDEYQADSLGVLYAREAKYAPGEMLKFFSSLERLTDDGGKHRLPNFLSTHPLTPKRIVKAQELLKPEDARLAVRREDYMARINGVVYGDNPRQGFVEGHAFYQPDLAFTFLLPSDWAIENTPKQVLLMAKDGKAAMVLQAESSPMDVDEYAKKQASQLGEAQFLNRKSMSINGFQSIDAFYQVPQKEKEALKIQLTCIRKEGMIYTFSSISTASAFDGYSGEFNRTARSFRKLSDPQHLSPRPSRLQLVKASGRDTLRAILTSSAVDRKLWDRLAVYNYAKLDSVPAAGSTVKIIR